MNGRVSNGRLEAPGMRKAEEGRQTDGAKGEGEGGDETERAE